MAGIRGAAGVYLSPAGLYFNLTQKVAEVHSGIRMGVPQ
jgi:hypothetical protein